MTKIKTTIYYVRKFNLIKFLFFSLIKSERKKITNEEVLVISPGGVATTMLINYLQKYVKINDKDNFDGNKHLDQVPLAPNTKIIYLYSNNYNELIASLKRRLFYFNNCAWLKSSLAILFFFLPKTSEFFFKKALDKQTINFLSDRKVLCIEYENIWSEKEKIQSFLGLIHKPDFIINFPAKRPRKT